MGFAVFLMAAAITIFLEATFWRRLTPNLVAAIPTTILVIVATLVTPYFGFVNPSTELYLLLSLFFLTGSLSSLLVVCIFRGHDSFRTKTISFSVQGQNLQWLKFFLLIACAIATYKAAQAYLVVGNLHDEEFSNMLSHGVAGHALVFSMLAAPILLLSRKKGDAFSLTIATISFLLLFLKQVKGWLVIPILFTLLMSWHAGSLRASRRGVFWLFALPFIAAGVFFGVYLLGWSSRAGFSISEDFFYSALEAISIHFLGYLVAGILGLSELINNLNSFQAEDPQKLIAPLYNLLALLQTAEFISPVSEHFFVINEFHSKGSNVYTLWGTLLLTSGILAFPIYFFIISILSTLLLLINTSRFIFFLYCYAASMLALSWFEYYYFHLAFYEGIFFLLFIATMQGKTRKRHLANSKHTSLGES